MREIITTTGASVFTACVIIAQAVLGGAPPAQAAPAGVHAASSAAR